MGYPTTNQYQETLLNPSGLFRTLGTPQSVFDEYGRLVCCSGSYSVVFKVLLEGTPYALKCYTRPDVVCKEVYAAFAGEAMTGGARDSVWVRARFCDQEMYVYDEFGHGCYYPVVLMDWVEGVTLHNFLRNLCQHTTLPRTFKKEQLERIAHKFDQLAVELLLAEFAHGDLKPENTMVTPAGCLRLVDYDGICESASVQQAMTSVGTPAFRHARSPKVPLGKRVDDFPIALISVALHALADCPEWYRNYCDGENLLFDPIRLYAGDDPAWTEITTHWESVGRRELCELAALLTSKTPELPALEPCLSRVLNAQ